MSGPVALITGAGSGIGRAVAIGLAKAGYRVVLTGRRRDALEATQGLIGEGRVMPTDVADEASVTALFDDVEAEFGRLDLLFNNAGRSAPAVPLDEVSVSDLRNLIDINVFGAFLCARSAFGLMRRQSPQGGRIINNGSVSAYGPRPFSAPYTASKHAITGLTKSLILDGRAWGITASQIDIGNAITDMSAKMETGVLQADGGLKPEPRIDVAHVVTTVVHMASLPPEANMPFVTVMATGMPLYGRG
ncbi:SDR family NAD(P)-dependent oxidoreductase [Asticcacaulis sp. BYS171W]|uniref:SDR family NAD(P)-dependent oxidoreductase n=1 Tax=Asticcacaulis aquaticus TaxID=2984212 RepID=A0ABT5HYW6_9CAUL|nr:SDR family oxidoreductase [Asticcacaulis aquaticus]MDC7685218.1 SDR family NAD(P)-dependent oxidoreductase [Asticcacaulis aquaticus]